jgi:hypothetical protein
MLQRAKTAQAQKTRGYIMDEDLILLKRLEHLRDRHRELDEQIKELSDAFTLNQLMIMRLKKEKLTLRDEIARIERIVYPDLIA